MSARQRRRKRVAFTRTRCPQCWSELRFTDDEVGDDVIDEHIRTRCKKTPKTATEEGVDE